MKWRLFSLSLYLIRVVSCAYWAIQSFIAVASTQALQKSADYSGHYSIEPPIIGLVAQACDYRVRQIDLSERDANTNLRKPTKRKRKVP